MRRLILTTAAAALVVLGGCGTAEDPGLVGTPPAETATSTPAPTTDAHTIEVEVEDGKPVGGVKREEVDLGDEVRLIVRSDVADEIHLHGYDRTIDLQANGESILEFTADIPGVFIVELEERKEHILEIEVR